MGPTIVHISLEATLYWIKLTYTVGISESDVRGRPYIDASLLCQLHTCDPLRSVRLPSKCFRTVFPQSILGK